MLLVYVPLICKPGFAEDAISEDVHGCRALQQLSRWEQPSSWLQKNASQCISNRQQCALIGFTLSILIEKGLPFFVVVAWCFWEGLFGFFFFCFYGWFLFGFFLLFVCWGFFCGEGFILMHQFSVPSFHFTQQRASGVANRVCKYKTTFSIGNYNKIVNVSFVSGSKSW